MKKNSIDLMKQEQGYKMLIRHLRKQREGKNNETSNNQKIDINQSK